MWPVRIVIAEDEPGFLEQLSEQLKFALDLEIVGEARDAKEAFVTVGQLNPDILILGNDRPGIKGWEVLRVVRWCSPHTKVIILSSHAEEATILEALELGARGYIVKGNGTNIEKAIRAVQRGELWARRRLLTQLLERYVGLAGSVLQATEDEPAPAPLLSKNWLFDEAKYLHF
ncbi:MAG: response regulator transcription factor [Candidatus Methylomirabilis oxyfera]|nr:response regulator transcription factor [Candidatus Methylomirabilis oxyfera]